MVVLVDFLPWLLLWVVRLLVVRRLVVLLLVVLTAVIGRLVLPAVPVGWLVDNWVGAVCLGSVVVVVVVDPGWAAGWPVVVGLAVWGSVVPLGELVVLEDDVDGVHVLLSQGFCALGARLHNCEYVAICDWLQMVRCNGGKE